MFLENDKVVLNSLFKSSHNKNTKQIFYYLPNPDNSIRWIYPKSLRDPTFLSFYSISSTRAKILALIFKISFYFRLNKKIKIEIYENSIIDVIINKYKEYNYSIFTGTVGLNRKAIVEINKKNKTKYFIKVALTSQSKELIQNEALVLNELNQYNYSTLTIPKVVEQNGEYITIDNISPSSSNQLSTITDVHLTALNEIYENTKKDFLLGDNTFYKSIKENLYKLKNSKIHNKFDKEKISQLQENMNFVFENLDHENNIKLSYGHCDFTPWNMFIENNHLYLFDWELAKKNIVLLYDFFHFIFQSEILIYKSSYNTILQKIKKQLDSNKALKNIIKKNSINFEENYKLYLLYTVSYYINKYNHQEKLHEQVFWLIDVWNKAFKNIVEKKGNIFE